MVVFLLCAPNTDKQAATVGHPTLSLLDRIDDGRSTEDQAGGSHAKPKSRQVKVTPRLSLSLSLSLRDTDTFLTDQVQVAGADARPNLTFILLTITAMTR